MKRGRAVKKHYHKGNRLLSAFGFSMAGLQATWADELAFRQVVFLGIAGLIGAFLLPLNALERALWILPIGISWVTELLNSAIENVVDLASPDLHPLAKKAKDMGSAAQFVALSLIFIIWGTILWGHL